MTRIAEAKVPFGNAFEEELDELATDIASLVRRAREAAKDTRRLNDLGASFNGLACTLEIAAAQVEDTRAEVWSWLAVGKEPIVTVVNPELAHRVVGAKEAQA